MGFTDIARALQVKYSERGENGLNIWKLEKDSEARRIEMTVAAGGWPGSNAETRKNNAEAAYLADPTLKAHGIAMEALHRRQVTLDEEINGLEAVRRGEEWRVRENIAAALFQGAIQQNGRGDRFEAAEDDAMLKLADQSAEERVLGNVGELAGEAVPFTSDAWMPRADDEPAPALPEEPDWLKESMANLSAGAAWADDQS